MMRTDPESIRFVIVAGEQKERVVIFASVDDDQLYHEKILETGMAVAMAMVMAMAMAYFFFVGSVSVYYGRIFTEL